MMVWLFVAALAAQSADATYSCHVMRHGGRELNPLLGQSCTRLVMAKAVAMTMPVLVPKGKLRALRWR